MATVQKAAARPQRASRRTGAPAGFASARRFDVGNEPNADILLTSLRSAGYSLESVVGDLIDNSIDAAASLVVVNVAIDGATGEWILDVADDGDGMDLPTLDQMMRLGSRAEHDLTSDLGAFGLGSDTAALALGRNKHVITSYEPSAWAASMWDLDVIVQEKQFVKYMADATEDEVALFRAVFDAARVEAPETGTLVRISKCDRVGRKSLRPAEKAILKYVGQTFRRFLVPTGGLTVYVNGQQAEPIDPMMRSHTDSMVLLDEQIDVEVKDGSGSRSEKVGVFVVHLPDFGGQEANNEHGIRIETSGFHVLRNGREITAATTLGLFTRHNALSRFRAELNFPAALDSELGVTFLKSSHELRLSQALHDKIEQVVKPYIRQSRTLYYGSRPTAPESVPHDEAAKFIKSRSPFLRKPQAEIERRARRQKTDEKSEPKKEREEPGRDRTPRDRTQKALADVAEFRALAMGVTAPFYEGMLIGRKIIVTYNSDHPAYQRLILENRDNRGQITAIDFLVWSLVASELRNVDDDNARFMQAMREDASFNLRQLLTV